MCEKAELIVCVPSMPMGDTSKLRILGSATITYRAVCTVTAGLQGIAHNYERIYKFCASDRPK